MSNILPGVQPRDQVSHSISQTKNEKEWVKNLTPKKVSHSIKLPIGYGKKQIKDRWAVLLGKNGKYKEWMKNNANEVNRWNMHLKDVKDELLDDDSWERSDCFKNNVENFVGTVKVPVGFAGPLRVNGSYAQGDYFIPLATTEAALLASINRGISLINASGGACAMTIQQATNRDPCFSFASLADMGQFLVWAGGHEKAFKEVAEKTTRFGKLKEIKYVVDARDVHMRCYYETGDASGQNMVTLATEKILEYIEKECPVKVQKAMLEGNMSGDKKASTGVLKEVRGYRVVAEVTTPKKALQRVMHVSPQEVIQSVGIGTRGLLLNGSTSVNLHMSNAYTAMAIATGQDPACAAEAHVGICRCELTKDGDLYTAVTLPNLLCATVGGGTKLPSQLACLKLMGLAGPGKSYAFAEVLASTMLAGELSLGCAINTSDFARAHKLLARGVEEEDLKETDTLDDRFTKSQAILFKFENQPSSGEILKLYGLYKQGTVGNVDTSKKPGMFSLDLKAKAKYKAWKDCSGLGKEEAKEKYIALVLTLKKADEQKKATKTIKK